MMSFFDIIAAVFVLSSAYLLFRTGMFASVGLVIIALMARLLFQVVTTQHGGLLGYTAFFLGTVAISGAVIGLFVVHFNVILKFDIVKVINRLSGAVIGGLSGLVFISAVMLPIVYNVSDSFGQLISSSYTVSYVIPWVQEIFPETQARIIGKINRTMVPPPPAEKEDKDAAAQDKKKAGKKVHQKNRGIDVAVDEPAADEPPAAE